MLITPRSALNRLGRGLLASRNKVALSSAKFNSSPTSRSEFRHSDDLAKERYDLRAGDDESKKRARLLYQSRKRGMLENGVILASFADKFLNQLDAQELDEYDRLINLPTNDWDIFYWATKTKPTPPEYETKVMQKLREHLKSKVSKSKKEIISESPEETKPSKSVFDGKKPDEIVFAPVRKPNLDVDISQVDTTNYKSELFSDRVIKLKNDQSILEMTEWRKKHFEHRLRRSISSPVSLRNMSDNKNIESHTQRLDELERHFARDDSVSDIQQDTQLERDVKHHNFLKYLLNSEFTLDPIEYDQEAAAWADMLWHRNYGSPDNNLAPSSSTCLYCNSLIQCCDYGLPGYVPKEIFTSFRHRAELAPICQRCNFERKYQASLDCDMPTQSYPEVLEFLRQRPRALICYLVDLSDLPTGIYENIVELVGLQHYFIVVGNKLDLLPHDGPHMIERVTESLRENLSRMRPASPNRNIADVMVLSARTGFNINSLVSRILNFSMDPIDVFLLGASNSGKSTLFNALLQSELSATQNGDLLERLSTYDLSTTDLAIRMLRFPISVPDDYEKYLKRRRTERVERNTALQERAMQTNTKHRQAKMPHMSMVINRFEFPALETSEGVPALREAVIVEEKLKVVEDHPLAEILKHEIKPLSADENKFQMSGYLHDTPSTYTDDQIHNLLTLEERLEVFPNETIMPRKYSLRPLQSIFIAGLARLDILTCTSSIIVVVFASKYLPIHIVPIRKADQFYHNFLGTPLLGIPFATNMRSDDIPNWPNLKPSEETFHLRGRDWHEGVADIVLTSIGWAMIRVKPDQECILQAHTPEARGIFCRKPPLAPYASASITGKKIRDTPLFDSPSYKVKQQINLD